MKICDYDAHRNTAIVPVLHLNMFFIWLMLIFNWYKCYSLNTREDNIVDLPYSWKLHVCVIKEWVTEQRSFGKYHFSWKYIQTCRLQITSADLSWSSTPPLLFYFSFLLSGLPLSVSGIVHVFTSKVIVPDLYDRPLTLRVLVHQHQAENTQGHVWAGPNLALCHSIAVTSNWNALQQITVIPALLKCESITQG